MIISFAGHSSIRSQKWLKEAVKQEVSKAAESAEEVTCYLGGYGGFDDLCAVALKELKQELPHIEIIYVTPYIGPSADEKIKFMQSAGLCDSSVYPPIEGTPLRFAISKRNEWMMKNADLVIAYVTHTYGGAYKTLRVAQRNKKKIVNLGEGTQQDP